MQLLFHILHIFNLLVGFFNILTLHGTFSFSNFHRKPPLYFLLLTLHQLIIIEFHPLRRSILPLRATQQLPLRIWRLLRRRELIGSATPITIPSCHQLLPCRMLHLQQSSSILQILRVVLSGRAGGRCGCVAGEGVVGGGGRVIGSGWGALILFSLLIDIRMRLIWVLNSAIGSVILCLQHINPSTLAKSATILQIIRIFLLLISIFVHQKALWVVCESY